MYCPSCRSEYRAGFTSCPPCGGVELVKELPDADDLSEEELETAQAVGFVSSSEVGHIIEVDGRTIDFTRLFAMDLAQEVHSILEAAGIPCGLVPLLDVDFPDQRPRFEVRVRAGDHVKAEGVLRAAWKARVDAEGTVEAEVEGDIEHCPACGAHVPLSDEECPECGLMVGGAEDEEPNEAEAEAD